MVGNQGLKNDRRERCRFFAFCYCTTNLSKQATSSIFLTGTTEADGANIERFLKAGHVVGEISIEEDDIYIIYHDNNNNDNKRCGKKKKEKNAMPGCDNSNFKLQKAGLNFVQQLKKKKVAEKQISKLSILLFLDNLDN
jgi:hypothetical protein